MYKPSVLTMTLTFNLCEIVRIVQIDRRKITQVFKKEDSLFLSKCISFVHFVARSEVKLELFLLPDWDMFPRFKLTALYITSKYSKLVRRLQAV